MNKTVMVKSGGDWCDASAELIVVPAGLDMESTYQEYRKWYEGDVRGGKAQYMPFLDWLKAHKSAADSDIEEFWETY